MECFGALRRSASNGTTNPYTKALEPKHIKKRIKSLIEKGFYIPAFALVLIYTLQIGEEVLYRGTCRTLTKLEQEANAKRRSPATRIAVPDEPFSFNDLFQGLQSFNLTECSGDFIIQRSDGVFAYQLAVTVDDAWMGVTSVVRGRDLLTSTPRQMYLQKCLGYETPTYGHVPLLVDSDGHRFAKRNQSTDIDYLLNEKRIKPECLLGKIAYLAGIVDEMRSFSLEELIQYANLKALNMKKELRIPDSFVF